MLGDLHVPTYLKKRCFLEGLCISANVFQPLRASVFTFYDAVSEIWTQQVEGTSRRWPFIHRVYEVIPEGNVKANSTSFVRSIDTLPPRCMY